MGLDPFWTSVCVCVVAGWERGAKTVLETGEKVKIPWGQQGPGGNKISGKILRMNEDFLKILGGCEDRSKMGIGGFSLGTFWIFSMKNGSPGDRMSHVSHSLAQTRASARVRT